MISIFPVPAFQDNYIWLISDHNKAWVVDPGDAQPVLQYLEKHQLSLAGILATHHHYDHIGGVSDLLRRFRVPVYGNPKKINDVSVPVKEGDTIDFGEFELRVIAVPGHTLDHIAWFGSIPDHGACLFCGDTLFSAGCGRLFEGTPDMMLNSLGKLADLPASTKIFCAHEYTLANLAFAQAVMPESPSVKKRIDTCRRLRSSQQPTLPVSLSDELTYNPFLMSADEQVIKAASERLGQDTKSQAEVFAAIRQWKDSF